MTVVGFNLKKILVERKNPVRGEVKVNTKMNILDVQQEQTKIISGKDVLSCNFEFLIQYFGMANSTGNIADLLFEGTVLYIIEPKETKKILDGWKKKELPQDMKVRILNTILTKCNLKALVLEDELGLPPHLPLPKFQPKEKEKKK